MPAEPLSPIFAGRQREVALINGLASRAFGEDPVVVLVGGDAGVGKTRLIDEVGARLALDGATVLTGHCVDLGDPVPFAPFVGVLRALVRAHGVQSLGTSARELVALLPELASAIDIVPQTKGDGPTRLHESVAQVLVQASAAVPLVVVVEDLHWSDRATRDLLAYLARGLADGRVLVLATYRSDDVTRSHPLRPFLAEMDRLPRVQHTVLDPLDREEVRAQLTGILQGPPTAPLLDEVYRRSEGNPFFVEELAGCQSNPETLRLSDTARDLLLTRVDALSPPTRGVLRAAAACGVRTPYALVRAVSVPRFAPDELALQAAIREAVDANVLRIDSDDLAFRHALLREAVHDDLLPGEHQAMHVVAAEALRDDPSLMSPRRRASSLAHHWNAARVTSEALTAAYEAAGFAADAYAYAEQQRLLERVLELWANVPDAAERLGTTLLDVEFDTGESAMAAGEYSRALAHFESALLEARLQGDDRRWALALAHRGKLRRHLGLPGGVGDLRMALERVGPEPSADRVLILDLLGNALVLKGLPEEALGFVDEAVAMLAIVGDDLDQRANLLSSRGEILVTLGEIEEGLQTQRAIIDEVHDGGSLSTLARLLTNLSDNLCALGRFEESVEVAREGVEVAGRVGRMRSIGTLIVGNVAEPLIEMGRLDEAQAVLEDGLRFDPPGVTGGFLHQLAGILALRRGHFELAREHSRVVHQAAVQAPYIAPQFSIPEIWLRAYVQFVDGDLRGALDIVDEDMSDEATPALERFEWPVVNLAVRAAVELVAQASIAGDVDVTMTARSRAAAWLRRAERLPGIGSPAAAWRLTTVADAAGLDGDEQVEPWLAAAEAWGKISAPFERGRALLRAGTLLAGSDDPRDRSKAAELLGEVVSSASAMGAEPLRSEAVAIARRSRLRLPDFEASTDGELDSPAAMPHLTPREADVLRLVAEGFSNRQIGERLYLSPKTVSVHVSNILAKLQVSSRGEAAAVAFRVHLLD